MNKAFLFILMILPQLSGGDQANLEFKNFVKQVLLREDDPHKKEEIIGYAKRSGVEPRQVAHVLEAIMNETLDVEEPESERSVLCKMSIDVLGKLGDAESLPLLASASTTKDRNLRVAAISAYVKIARENSIVFAKSIVAHPDQYGTMERYILYERLAEHARKAEEATLDKARKAVRRFLIDVVQTEPNPENVRLLDKMLSSSVPLYKTSQQREVVAKRFVDAKMPIFRDYFNGVISELNKVPIANRTDANKEEMP